MIRYHDEKKSSLNRLLVRAPEGMGDAYRATLVEEETKNDMPPDEIELAQSGRGAWLGNTTDQHRVEGRV